MQTGEPMSGEDVTRAGPAPLAGDRLDPFCRAWLRELFDRVGRFVQPTLERWESGFLQEGNVAQEVIVWEAIAQTFEAYTSEHPDVDRCGLVRTISAITAGVMFEEETPETEALRQRYRVVCEEMQKDGQTQVDAVLSRLRHKGLLD